MIISLVMVIVLISTNCVFADSSYKTESISDGLTVESVYSKLQISKQEAEFIIGSNVSYDSLGNRVEVADLSNGNIMICVFGENGELISTSCFCRADRLLYQYYEHSTVGVTIKEINVSQETLMSDYTEEGNQRYIVPVNAETGARVTCIGSNYGTKTIDIFGEYLLVTGGYYTRNQLYHDFAELVSEVNLVLSSPGFIISPFLTLLLTAAGLAVTTIDFILYVKVRCNKEYITWKAYDTVTSQSTSFMGMKYYCEQYNGVDYSHDDGTGNYYAINSLRQYNTSLAKKCYSRLYGSDTITVSTWYNVW